MRRLLTTLVILGIFLTWDFFSPQKKNNNNTKPIVGILQLTSHPALNEIHQGIIAGLKQQGFVNHKNIEIDFQNAQNDQSSLKTMSERFINENSAVTIGIATPAAQALANTTKTTPVVMGAISDPIGAKLVNNLKHPDQNVTGVMHVEPVLQQVTLIKKILPNLKTIGVLYTASDDSATASYQEFARQAKKQGLIVKPYTISSTNDAAQVASVLAQEIQALYLPTDNNVASAAPTIINTATQYQVPVFSASSSLLKDGALATVSVSQFDLGKLTGQMAAEILKGKKPANMAIRHVKKTYLSLNLKQAQKLNIQIPNELLTQAQQKGEIIS